MKEDATTAKPIVITHDLEETLHWNLLYFRVAPRAPNRRAGDEHSRPPRLLQFSLVRDSLEVWSNECLRVTSH